MWFNKSRRAQNDTDFETWVEGGVVPTLNAFDNGDIRATTVIIMRMREGKPGGGKGPLLSENRSLTIATNNDQTMFIFHPHRSDGVRLQGETVNTLTAFMGTGGLNTPMVASIQNTVIGRSDTAGPQGKGYADNGEPMFTLDTTSPHAVSVTPIQDGRPIDKKQNGLGVGNEGDPSYTLDTKSHQAIAFSHTQGLDIQASEEATPTLRREGNGMAVAYDEYNDSIGQTHHTLRSGTKQSTGVVNESVVRRLTPIECERLQGFPDNWTEGQSDTHRYKQMGNAVAVPVVEWLVANLVENC